MLSHLVDDPTDSLGQRIAKHGAAGVADCRHQCGRPITCTAATHLRQQQAVRQENEVGVPGLALAISQLTVSEPQVLLAVPMKRLRTGPATAVRSHYALHFPVQLVGDDDFGCGGFTLALPQNDHLDLVVQTGNANAA